MFSHILAPSLNPYGDCVLPRFSSDDVARWVESNELFKVVRVAEAGRQPRMSDSATLAAPSPALGPSHHPTLFPTLSPAPHLTGSQLPALTAVYGSHSHGTVIVPLF